MNEVFIFHHLKQEQLEELLQMFRFANVNYKKSNIVPLINKCKSLKVCQCKQCASCASKKPDTRVFDNFMIDFSLSYYNYIQKQK